MRAIVTRVQSASVSVDGEVVGAIDPDSQGLLVLIGVTHTDTPQVARQLAEKMWQLRILDDQRSAAEVGAQILVISQFTLYADVRKGRRPSWNAAAPADVAEPLVDEVCAALSEAGATVATGRFGANMQVSSINDGPVTIVIDL